MHFFIIVICQNRIILSCRSLDYQGLFKALRLVREYTLAGKEISISIKTTSIDDNNHIRYLPLRSFVPINRTADYELDDEEDEDEDDDEDDDDYNDYSLTDKSKNDDLEFYFRDSLNGYRNRTSDDDDDE